jgi:conjugative relaxase-like TrwC/TraI family protein
MLRITPSKASASQVKNYFIKHSSPEMYYSEGQDFNGIWVGKGAARLGLSGSLQEGAFSRLCDNLHPLTGEQLTARMKENRRVGYDVNFHVPKSVSLAYFYSKDERIIQKIRQAAYETILKMQEDAAARVRKGDRNRDEDRKTAELVAAEFLHKTARPVGGFPDPLLHVHMYVFNATYDSVEQKWKALQFGWVMEDAPDYEELFHQRVREGLQELGLKLEPTDYAFEIAGVERPLIEKFSRRTQQVHAEAARRGMTDAGEIDKLGALTRERKVQDVPVSELEPIWWARLSPEERQVLESIKATLEKTRECSPEGMAKVLGSQAELNPKLAAAMGDHGGRRLGVDEQGRPMSMNRATWPVEPKTVAPVEPTKHDLKAVRYAVEHLFERQSVVSELQLIAEAFRNWSDCPATLAGVTQAVKDWPLLRVEREGRMLITTREVLEEEKRIAKLCREGRDKFSYINPNWEIQNEQLTLQQRSAVQHVLHSPDFVTGISGKAGTGKTTLLREAENAIRAAGRRLMVFAPTAEAARDTLRNQGFEEADTVARLLTSSRLQQEAANAVWWIDEAGLMSCRSMDRLLALADTLNARVVLVGDAGQHHAVERGQAFDLLQKQGGLRVAEVSEIQRQRGEYRAAVDLIARREYEAGLDALERMGAFCEIANQAERERALAKDYVDACERGEIVQVICPTHKEGRSLTRAIRQELKARGELGEGRNCHILRNLSWTEAQKRDGRSYSPGLIVEVNRPTKGFAIGERLEVVQAGEDKVLARGREGLQEIPLSHPGAFNVFEREAIEICVGDKIRITANGRSADENPLTNGKCYRVQSITREGELRLDNGWYLDGSHAHIDHGYVTTSHVAQSKTVERVFVLQSAELSAGATDANQFYVSISRGRKGVKIYTDDIELLRENVSRVRERPMAMEVLQQENATEETRSPSASALLGQEAEIARAEQAEVLRRHVKPEREPQAVEVPATGERLAERLGTKQDLERELAAELKRRAEEKDRKRRREQELEMAMG